MQRERYFLNLIKGIYKKLKINSIVNHEILNFFSSLDQEQIKDLHTSLYSILLYNHNNRKKDIKVGKEEVKFFLFTGNIDVYPKESMKHYKITHK